MPWNDRRLHIILYSLHFIFISSPFYRHFTSILSSFHLHFIAILPPFYRHLTSILSPFCLHFLRMWNMKKFCHINRVFLCSEMIFFSGWPYRFVEIKVKRQIHTQTQYGRTGESRSFYSAWKKWLHQLIHKENPKKKWTKNFAVLKGNDDEKEFSANFCQQCSHHRSEERPQYMRTPSLHQIKRTLMLLNDWLSDWCDAACVFSFCFSEKTSLLRFSGNTSEQWIKSGMNCKITI